MNSTAVAYREARRQAYGQSIARLQQGSAAAATTLLKVMLDASTPHSTLSPDGNQVAFEWDQDKHEPRIFIKLVGPGEPVYNLSGIFGSGIAGMAFAPSDATCAIYAFGSYGGSLRLTKNGGSAWVNINPAGAVPLRAVTDLAFDPANPNALYVTLSGFDEATPGHPGHVFKTTNALSATPIWTNVSPPVNIPHNTVALDPTNPSIVYVGTDVGVWRSVNGGLSWVHMGPKSGMPNVAVFELQINSHNLVAFTHGRGAFQLQVGVEPPDTN